MVLLSLICTISRGVDWVCSYSMSCATSFAIRFSIKGGEVEAGIRGGDDTYIWLFVFMCIGASNKIEIFFYKKRMSLFQ